MVYGLFVHASLPNPFPDTVIRCKYRCSMCMGVWVLTTVDTADGVADTGHPANDDHVIICPQ